MAGTTAGGKRDALEHEFNEVNAKVTEKEAALQELLPQWDDQRTREAAEKRNLDEVNAKLGSLFAKQGRATKFRTKAERDAFLRHELQSMNSYKAARTSALQATQEESTTARTSQTEIESQINGVQGKIEDGRKRVKDVGEEINTLKENLTELQDRRKDLWREDTKLDSLVSRAGDELRTAERSLAGMMDKVCSI